MLHHISCPFARGIQFALCRFHSRYYRHRICFLFLRVLRYFSSPSMLTPLFMVCYSVILGSKADLRLPQAYRSLPRPSSLLEPSHPLGGLKNLQALLLLKSIANAISRFTAESISSVLYFSRSKRRSRNTEAYASFAAIKAPALYCSGKVYIHFGIHRIPIARCERTLYKDIRASFYFRIMTVRLAHNTYKCANGLLFIRSPSENKNSKMKRAT